MAELLYGNPFTHEQHRRVSRPGSTKASGCDWCGQNPKSLFNYDYSRGWFCNKECHHSYHG
jgi:hypothetical protein